MYAIRSYLNIQSAMLLYVYIYIWNLIAFATFLLLFFHIVFHFTIICHSLFCEHICILLQDLTLRQIDLCYVITVRTDIILYFIV